MIFVFIFNIVYLLMYHFWSDIYCDRPIYGTLCHWVYQMVQKLSLGWYPCTFVSKEYIY